jgi:HEPN domain-containing protein
MQSPVPLSILEKHCIKSNGKDVWDEDMYEEVRCEYANKVVSILLSPK